MNGRGVEHQRISLSSSFYKFGTGSDDSSSHSLTKRGRVRKENAGQVPEKDFVKKRFLFFFLSFVIDVNVVFILFLNFAALKCDVIGGARRPDLYTVCRDPTRISCNQKKTPSSSTLIFNMNENGREIQIKISRDYAGVASQSAKHQRKKGKCTRPIKRFDDTFEVTSFSGVCCPEKCQLHQKRRTHTHTHKINIQLGENHSIRILLFFSFTRPISNNNVATLFSFPPPSFFFFWNSYPTGYIYKKSKKLQSVTVVHSQRSKELIDQSGTYIFFIK